MRLRSPFVLVVVLFALTACPDEFDDNTEAIVGSWELREISGMPFESCTLVDGTLTITDQLDGDFIWSATCTDGMDIEESSEVEQVEVQSTNVSYELLLTRNNMAFEWDCILEDDGDMDCTEDGPFGLARFGFQRD